MYHCMYPESEPAQAAPFLSGARARFGARKARLKGRCARGSLAHACMESRYSRSSYQIGANEQAIEPADRAKMHGVMHVPLHVPGIGASASGAIFIRRAGPVWRQKGASQRKVTTVR